MTTRPVTQSAGLNPGSRLRARLGLQVKRMLGLLVGSEWIFSNNVGMNTIVASMDYLLINGLKIIPIFSAKT